MLRCVREKTGWGEGMALRFEERYYRLSEVRSPDAPSAAWEYRFAAWLAGEVFRRLVDYEQDCAARAEADAKRLGPRLSRWFGKSE